MAKRKKARLKVLFVNALFHPFVGGVEKHILELGAALAGRGVEVHVLTGRLKGTKAEETLRGIRVHRIPCSEVKVPGLYPPPLISSPHVFTALQALDSKHHFDVIHLENRWFPDFDVAGLYAKAVGTPFVVTIHNARPVGIAPHYTLFGGLYDAAVGSHVLRLADRLVSVSRWAVGDIGKYGIPASKFTVIPNGVDTLRKPAKPGFRRKYSIGSAPMLLFMGRLIKQKGLEYMLAAMPSILAHHPDAKLVIAGRGNETAYLRDLAVRDGVGKNVIFTGYVDDELADEAFAECDVFVLPSLWEVLPVAAIQALSAGKPVVCTSVGGNEELVTDGYNGFVVPPRNPKALARAVNRLVGDSRLRERMGRNSRLRAVKEFDWRIIAANTEKFYRALVDDDYSRRQRQKKPLDLMALPAVNAQLRKSLKRGMRKEIVRYVRKWSRAFRRAV